MPAPAINQVPCSKESMPAPPLQIDQVLPSKEPTPAPSYRASKELTPGLPVPAVQTNVQNVQMLPTLNGYFQNVQVPPVMNRYIQNGVLHLNGAYVGTTQASLPAGPYTQPPAPTYIPGAAPPGIVSSLPQQPWGYGPQHSEYSAPHGIPGYMLQLNHPGMYLHAGQHGSSDSALYNHASTYTNLQPALFDVSVPANAPVHVQNMSVKRNLTV